MALLSVPAERAAAQCTLTSSPLSFEPFPPGASRPFGLNSGHNSDLKVYQAGASSRMLMQESFGYSILDLSNPGNPSALLYRNMINSGEVPYSGDGQSYIKSIGVSPDGQRLALGLTGNAHPDYKSVAATANASGFSNVTGGFVPRNSGGMVVQKISNRYLAYALIGSSGIDSGSLTVADITNLPGPMAPVNLPSENVGNRGGAFLTLAGNNVVFLDLGTIRIFDVSNPGPVGNISGSFGLVTITSGDFGGNTPTSLSAATDPADPAKLWVLVELSNPLAYALVSVKGGVKTVNAQTFTIPQPGGETWVAGGVSAVVANGNSLTALMWAKKFGSPVVYRLFSTNVAAWGGVTPGQIDLDSATYPTFALNYTMRGLAGAGNAIYAYVPTGGSAYVLPMSCATVPAPPVSDIQVQYETCPGASPCPLSPGDPVFVGTKLRIAPSAVSLHTLTEWRFDFDWHAAEENVPFPRVQSPDLAYPAALPATIALYGPCDPRGGGVPSTGAGCWASATANGDFAANAAAGTTTSLRLALEAANDLGAGNTRAFPITWKVPAVRLQNPGVLLGNPVVSGAEGTPLASGYKWYFGSSPAALALDASCTAASCNHNFGAKGTYYYWLTVPYPTGYTSPDCGSPCSQNLGTIAVTDVSLAFTGIATTAVAGTAVSATDASSVASGASPCGSGLEYSLCNAGGGSCAAGSWSPLAINPLGSGLTASIPVSSTASTYWLRIRYAYKTTGSCASPIVTSWTPSVSGVSDPTAWPIVVTPAPPVITVRVNGLAPCVGAGGGCADGIPVNLGDTITVWAVVSGAVDRTPPASTAWTFGASASPAGCSGTGCQGTAFQFTAPGTFTITLAGYAIGASATFSVSAPPVTASNGGAVCAGSALALFAAPTFSGATYAWTGPNGFTSALQNPTVPFATPAASGTYAVVRTFSGQTSAASTSGVVNPSPPVPAAGNNGPLCPGATLALTAAPVAGATYAWTGPNGFTSALQNPTVPNVTAAGAGTYVVLATVLGCSTAASTTVTVNTPPAAPVAGNSGPLCIGGTLALTAQTIPNAAYTWTGPNGFTSSLQNPSIANASPAAGGVYLVTATVNGCTGPGGSTSAVVSGSSAAITAPASLCLPNAASGTASVANAGTGAAYAWTVTNGTIVSGQGTPSISFSVSAAGTTTVAATVTAGGCVSSSSVPIPVAATCGGLNTLAPCRVVDTRSVGTGGPSIGPGSGRKYVANGACGIPSGMAALSANVTVLSGNALGSVVVYPGDLAAPPNAITVWIRPGQIRANNAIVKLAPDGSYWIWNTTSGTVDVILDVNGTFQ
ncbi:MAG: hypothetical protein PT977_08460 [Acidobacteriota bacterium]|nr:hypothetical protein [Acidobacteriota bacterium]